MQKISEHGTIHGIEGVPEDIVNAFQTAHDVTPEWHVKMQAAFQFHTDNAVSKTVNFSEEATREDIAKTYELAYKSGLKGTTVYRNNSRFNQAMQISSADKKEEATDGQIELGSVKPRQRPNVTFGITDKMGKSGGCATSQAEATGRMISLSLRAGVDINEIIEQLKGIRCPAPAFGKGGVILSCSDAVARVLERNLDKIASLTGIDNINAKLQSGTVDAAQIKLNLGGCKSDLGHCPECPDCGVMLEFSEGCVMCPGCGFSRCS